MIDTLHELIFPCKARLIHKLQEKLRCQMITLDRIRDEQIELESEVSRLAAKNSEYRLKLNSIESVFEE